MISKRYLLPLTFLIALAMLSGTVMATNITSCTVLNQSDTTYYLIQDIIDSSATTCMDMTGTNVTLDCQGHRIDGIYSEPSVGIEMHDNNIVRNCEVSDWFSGISLGNYCLVEDSETHHNSANHVGNNNIIRNHYSHDEYRTTLENYNLIEYWSCSNNEYGCMHVFGWNNTLRHSNFGSGITLMVREGEWWNPDNTTIYNNTFGNDRTVGLGVQSEYNNIYDNTFNNIYLPIFIQAGNNTIERNTINSENSGYGAVFYFGDYNVYNENIHNGTVTYTDIYYVFANWNTGCGNVFQYTNGTTRDPIIWEVSSFDNNITTEPCPWAIPEPEWAYTIPKDIIIHVVKQHPEPVPECVNCEIQHGHQTGVAFYVIDNCEDMDEMCYIWDYYGISNKTKLLTIDNDVCSDYTLMPNCGTPTNWKARGKATWVYHNLGSDSQPFISKYSDELGLNTEFDGITNKHKIKDDNGVFSESNDVYVADFTIENSKVTFYIANSNPSTIWTDKLYVKNHEKAYAITSMDALYTTHGKKKIEVKATLTDSVILVEPVNPKQKIPIESASGSNIIEIYYNPSSTGLILALLPLIIGVGIVVFTVREGLAGDLNLEKIVAIIITIVVAIALLGVLVLIL